MDNQQQVWNNIAKEWYEFKTKPAEHALEFLKNKKGKILDLGSGAGRHLKDIKEGEIYLVDFSEEMINLAKERAKKMKLDKKTKFFVSDISNLPFENDFFDSAIAIASLHCIKGEKQREKTVKELFRVLKPGAEAEISVWNKNSRRFRNQDKEKLVKWRDKGARYYYLFDAEEIYGLFEKQGFKIICKEDPTRNIVFIAKKPISLSCL